MIAGLLLITKSQQVCSSTSTGRICSCIVGRTMRGEKAINDHSF